MNKKFETLVAHLPADKEQKLTELYNRDGQTTIGRLEIIATLEDYLEKTGIIEKVTNPIERLFTI
jgi:hypothetical protein